MTIDTWRRAILNICKYCKHFIDLGKSRNRYHCGRFECHIYDAHKCKRTLSTRERAAAVSKKTLGDALHALVGINRFYGNYRFLSNFYICPIAFDGFIWSSAEAIYQSRKTEDEKTRMLLMGLTPGAAKELGQKIEVRQDWDIIKDGVMREIVYEKFYQNEALRRLLVNTFPAKLIEGNTWGDTYWGVCDGVGLNKLGEILMDVREVFMKAEREAT